MSDGTDGVKEIVTELRAIHAAVQAANRPPAELLDKVEVGAVTGLGASTVDRFRGTGQFGPTDIWIGGALRWRRVEVLAWIARPKAGGELMTREEWEPVWTELEARANRAK